MSSLITLSTVRPGIVPEWTDERGEMDWPDHISDIVWPDGSSSDKYGTRDKYGVSTSYDPTGTVAVASPSGQVLRRMGGVYYE